MQSDGSKPAVRRIYALIVVAVALLAVFAYRLFPIWDDGGTKLWADSGLPNHIRSALADRPFFAWILQCLADIGQLKAGGLIFYLLTWGGMAAVVLGWCRILGTSSELTAAVIALILAPVICQTQFILINPVISGTLGPVLAHAAALVLLAFSGSGYKVRTAVRALAIALVFLGGMLSEYGIIAALACSAVVWTLRYFTFERIASRADAGLLAAAAVVTYVIYHGVADAGARASTRPELTDAATFLYRLRMLPLRTFYSLWQAAVGQVAASVATVDWTSKASLAGTTFGLAAAAAGVRCLSHGREVEETPGVSLRAWIVCLIATIVGVVPTLLMGRVVVDAFTTRMWLPVLPFATYLSVCVWRRLLGTDRRVAFLTFFLFGSTVITQGLLQQAMNRELSTLNSHLRSYCSSDIRTLVVVEANWPPPYGEPRGFELTAKLTEGWPAAQARNVWAETTFDNVVREYVARKKGRAGDDGRLEIFDDDYFRQGAIDRVLYINIDEGTVVAEVSMTYVRDHLP